MIEFDKKWIAITSVSIAIFAVTIVGISSIPTASAGTLPLNCDGGSGTIQHYFPTSLQICLAQLRASFFEQLENPQALSVVFLVL